jgi:glucokinase
LQVILFKTFMSVLALDLGGTKLATALFSEAGNILAKEIVALGNREGKEVGALVAGQAKKFLAADIQPNDKISSIGICVPGISRQLSGTVWAPNIPGWDDYPLLEEIRKISAGIPVLIDSDRACCILGEKWQGNAQGCENAIFLSVGTGIGAGILVNGVIMRGAHDIAGAIGWMALQAPFEEKYIGCGCFEHYASGEGIAKLAREFLEKDGEYSGILKSKPPGEIRAHDLFSAYDKNDSMAEAVFRQCIVYWGMAVANLVSLFNPERILFGGGVFGPATRFIPDIQKEAAKWAQPISMQMVTIEAASLGSDAGLFGAGYLALQNR